MTTITHAAKHILRARLDEHRAAANTDAALSLYITAAPSNDDTHPAFQIVEQVTREGVEARARYHHEEASRLEIALGQVTMAEANRAAAERNNTQPGPVTG